MPGHIAVMDPFSNGRVSGKPDPNEFIVIRLDEALFDDDDGKRDR